MHVETVISIAKKDIHTTIDVKLAFDEGDFKSSLEKAEKKAEKMKPREKVTYKMIQEYIEEKYGFKVHSAFIAEVKRSLGLTMYEAPNKVDVLKQPRKHPTPEKVKAIKDAFRHFKMI